MALLCIYHLEANAQNDEPVSSELKVFKITIDASGDEMALEVSETQPGDTLEYRLTYTNNTAEAISNLVPTLPIPEGMQFIPNSASPEINKASTSMLENDFAPIPLTRTVMTDDGEQITKEISESEYRRLQWTVPALSGKESITLSARVIVVNNQ